MIDALISGKLIKTPELRTGQSGKPYAQFLMSVAIGEDKPTVISGMAFSDIAERIAKLQKGDSLAVIGSLKPTEWIDKATAAVKHGLSVTANNVLTPYDIKKRKQAVRVLASRLMILLIFEIRKKPDERPHIIYDFTRNRLLDRNSA